MNRLRLLSLLLAAIFTPAAATATPLGPVDVDMGILLEWQNEFRANAEDKAIDGTNNSFVRAELSPEIEFNDNFEINALAIFEPMAQAAALNAGHDIWFDHQGLYLEELYAEYDIGNVELIAGKFDPAFGVAWDYGRGIWGEDFAEDYEVTEKIGGQVTYQMETAYGEHNLAVSSFFNDTTFLSDSAIASRDGTNLNSGGAGNTEDFSSFVVQLDGENALGLKDFGYRIGYRYLAEQDKNQSATTDAESGYVLGFNYTVPVQDGLSFDTFAEYTHLKSFAGVKDDDRDYYSASVQANIGEKWNVTAATTFRDIYGAGATSKVTDTLLNLTAGYELSDGLTLEGGYRASDENSQEAHIFGFLLRYEGEVGG